MTYVRVSRLETCPRQSGFIMHKLKHEIGGGEADAAAGRSYSHSFTQNEPS